ncbi:hypothetical protein SEUCBS139899_002101 [Sporothrix eucalyptigena]
MELLALGANRLPQVLEREHPTIRGSLASVASIIHHHPFAWGFEDVDLLSDALHASDINLFNQVTGVPEWLR